MVRRWALVAADFSREYRIEREQMARMSVPEFMWRVAGLSDESRTRKAWTDEPKTLHDPADIDAVTELARR